jgi:signal transduction histidine kinase
MRRAWWSWLGGIRIRSALAAVAVTTVAVGAAALAMVYTARSTLTGNLDATASQRAAQVASSIRSGDATGLAQLLRSSAGDETVVHIFTPDGTVVASSAELNGRPPITNLRPAFDGTAWEQGRLLPDSEDPFRIVATSIRTDDGSRIVAVAQSLRPVNESIEALTEAVLVGMPLLALVVGVATFVFVGRSLRPVEGIRRRVAGITGRDLHAARVPVPAARDEVAALAETMNEMLDRLESSAAAQRRFVADASHELRSPLTTLRVGLDVLARHPHDQPAKIERLQAEAERLGRIVSDLLLLARADEHGLTPQWGDVDLDDLVYGHRERIQAQYRRLVVDASVQPVRVHGDAHQLDRAIGNLCDNAATHAGKRVALTLFADETHAHLVVGDDGPGIDAADRRRVFDRFVRLDDSRARSDGGSGLGLAITREIVHGHHGAITVGTSLLGGAALHVDLPVGGQNGGDACES